MLQNSLGLAADRGPRRPSRSVTNRDSGMTARAARLLRLRLTTCNGPEDDGMSPASEDASEPHTAVPAVDGLAHETSIPSGGRSRSGMSAHVSDG